MRWFEVESRFRHDARIKQIRRKFGKDGLASLVLLWGEIADHGARPGVGVHRDGSPLPVKDLAEATGLTVRRLTALVDYCADIGHVDRDRWKRDGVIVLPAMVRRARGLTEAKDEAERKAEQRERRFSRIAGRDGKKCCRCGAVEQLELERKIPKDEGGTDDDRNLQIVCVPCGRRRRTERQLERSRLQGGTGDPPPRIDEGSGMDREGSKFGQKIAERPQDFPQSVPQGEGTGVGTGGVSSTDRTHTDNARARILDPEPAPLPLVGAVPPHRPRVNPALVQSFTAGTLPRDHLKCLAPCGVICYPLALAEEHARALNTADSEAAMNQVRAFKDRVLAGIPPGQPIGDRPYDFWRAHWAAAHPSAAPSVPNASGRRLGGPDPSVARRPAPAGKYDHLTRRDVDAKRGSG